MIASIKANSQSYLRIATLSETNTMTSPNPNDNRFYCGIEGCGKSFQRRYDCDVRHRDEYHGPMKECPVEGCSWRNAKRQGRLHAHMKKEHKEHVPVELAVPNDLDRWSSQSVTTPAYDNGEAAPVKYSNTPAMPIYDNNQSTQATSAYASQYQYHPPMALPEGYTGGNYSTSQSGTNVEGQVGSYNNGSNSEDMAAEIDNQNYHWTS